MQRRTPRAIAPAVAALAAALALLVASGAAALASDDARVDIEVLDLAGQGVAGVTVTVTAASGASQEATTDAWGKARVRLEVAPGDSLMAVASVATREGAWSADDVGLGDRLDAAFTVPIAQGFTRVSAVRDVTGDGVADTVWHLPRSGAHDDWLVLGSDGTVRTARFGFGAVAWAGITRLDATPGAKVVALEQVSDGYRLWTWSPATGAESHTDVGSLPSLDALENDMDGDGLTDLLFYSSEPTADGFHFTAAFADGRVAHFTLGGPASSFFPELADVTGDGLPDVFVASAIPGQTIRWYVWQSDDEAVHTADMGTHGETVVDDALLDGDHDGLPEFLGAFEVDGVSRGWEVLEYATGDQFAVVLGPEDDRGPGSDDYPAGWFAP